MRPCVYNKIGTKNEWEQVRVVRGRMANGLVFLLGVYLIVRVSTVRGSFDTLLQEGDYSDGEKRAAKTLQLVSGAYWCLATAGYLGRSFASGNWQFTWIVWPVAGVLFTAVMLVARLVIGRRNDR